MNTRKAHGIPSQINSFVSDKETEMTGYGRHNRLLVFHSNEKRALTLREDLSKGLAMSTEEDRIKVLNGFQRMHPLGARPVSSGPSIPYQSAYGSSVEHVYGY